MDTSYTIHKVSLRPTQQPFGTPRIALRTDENCLQMPPNNFRLGNRALVLILCYKIVFGLVCGNFDDFFTFSPSFQTRGHSYKLYKPRCTNSVRQNFFVERVVDVWNCLPPTVSFSSLSLSLIHI